MLQNTLAFFLQNTEAGTGELDKTGEILCIELRLLAFPHPLQNRRESGFVNGGAHSVLNLQDKRAIFCIQRLLGIEGEVHIRGVHAANVRPAGAGFIYDHAVGAYQPVNEWLNVDGTKSCLAVGDHNAGLHNITGNYLCLQARIDNF